jgi:hypothetical protein
VSLELIRECGIIWFSIGLWNCSDSVALLVFHFSIGLWNCSDSVALLVCIWAFETVPTVWHYLFFLLDFGTVLTVWHYLFVYGTLELFRQCGTICFDMGF